MHGLYESVRPDAELWCRLQTTIRFGNPAEPILEVTKELDADWIV